MPSAAAPSAPQSPSHHQDVLDDFVDFGHRLVKLTVEHAEAGTMPVAKAAAAYDRVTSNARRCILLIRKLAEPLKATGRVAARKQILRTVEDAIQRDEDVDAETLHEELLDRLDTLDREDEIDTRPVEDIITDILRDFGLAAMPGTHPWKRRTPHDVATLNAQAHHRAAPTRYDVAVLNTHAHQPAAPTPRASPVGCNSS